VLRSSRTRTGSVALFQTKCDAGDAVACGMLGNLTEDDLMRRSDLAGRRSRRRSDHQETRVTL
jgi:hypothetical protein